MDASDGRSRVRASLDESLCHDSDIEFVVVFGSQVAGDTHSSSDIDVAVKFSDDFSSHERFQKQCFLSGTLQQTDAPFIDVSDIERLPVELTHEAVTGDLLCGDEQAFRQYKSDSTAVFEEHHDDIRRHQRGVIDRIAEDGLHG